MTFEKKVEKKNTTYVIDKYTFFSSIFLSTLCRQSPPSSKEEFSFYMEKSSFDMKAKALFYPPKFSESKNGHVYLAKSGCRVFQEKIIVIVVPFFMFYKI